MPRPINSFDVFDTLIARRSVEPQQVLHKVEERTGIPGLAAARLAADRRLGGSGSPYLLRDIWHETCRALGLAAPAAERLHDLEIQIEHEEVIPIVDNLSLVRDGDLLVSDTYLPTAVVRSLLHRAGLERTVALAVSNDGKFQGWVWPQLQARTAIREHLGDNPHSDGRTPSAVRIPAVIYQGAQRSSVEQHLSQQQWPLLANLIRQVRLANPFPPARSQERHLWQLTCQLNFPLLFFASLWLEQVAVTNGIRELLFVSRDGFLWRELFQSLYPKRRTTYLYASRLCSLKPSNDYLDYFRATWQADSALVDLFSTRASWAALFARLGVRGRCCLLGSIDNYSYLHNGLPPDDWLDVTAVFRTSQTGRVLNKNVEMLNYGTHPLVEDVRLLAGREALPVLAETLEYDPALPAAAHASFRACLRTLADYPGLTVGLRAQDVEKSLTFFVEQICDDSRLSVIYDGHQQADAAYMERLMRDAPSLQAIDLGVPVPLDQPE